MKRKFIVTRRRLVEVIETKTVSIDTAELPVGRDNPTMVETQAQRDGKWKTIEVEELYSVETIAISEIKLKGAAQYK